MQHHNYPLQTINTNNESMNETKTLWSKVETQMSKLNNLVATRNESSSERRIRQKGKNARRKLSIHCLSIIP